LIFALSGDLHESKRWHPVRNTTTTMMAIKKMTTIDDNDGRWTGKDAPGVKYDLVAPATIFLFKLEVVHGPTTRGLGQIGEEFLVVRRRRLFLHDDLRLVVADSEGDVLVFLAELQILEHLQALWVYANAGRLGKVSCSIC